MNLQEILILADELVFTSTGKHLDNLQQEVLKGILEGKRYGNIANEKEYSEGYIRDLASQLWQILSQELGENINKSNFKSTIERIYNDKYSTNFVNNNNNNINLCRYDSQNSNGKLPQESKLSETKSLEYLHKIPKLKNFYGRKAELEELQGIITEQECQLLTIYGQKGIGKTALTVKLLEQIKDNYKSVFWINLEYFANLCDLINYLIEEHINPEQKQTVNYSKTTIVKKLKTFIQNLSQYPSLIILDKLESILQPEKLAGTYQPEYQYFNLFIKAITKTNHQSCVILLTQELSRDLEQLGDLHESCQLFAVKGLGKDANYLLSHEKLREQNCYEQLTDIYQGNPLYLKLISKTIKKYFQGKISKLLEHKQPFIEDNLRSVLAEKLDLLTEREKQILTILAQNKQAITLEELQTKIKIQISELIINLQSLERRLLVEIKQNKNSTYLTIYSLYHSLVSQGID